MSYCLADIIRFNQSVGLQHNNSIARKYLKLNQLNEVNFDLLKSIVEERSCPPKQETISVHVRLGDIIGNTPLPNLVKIVKKHKLHNKHKHCDLYFGNHVTGIGGNHKQTEKELDTLKKGMENLGLETQIVSGTADEDFISLATSLVYVCGIRGFSWLSASINPNQVIWDAQRPPDFPWLMDTRLKGDLQKGYEYQIKNR